MSSRGHEAAIKGSRFFKSGEVFTLSEAWSALAALKGGQLSQSRVEEVLNDMIRNGIIDRVGDRRYRAQCLVKRFMSKAWRKHSDAQLGIEH